MQAHDQPMAPADRTPHTGGLFPQLGPPGAMRRFFKAHLWRHTAEKHMSLATLQELMAHKKKDTTLTYMHLAKTNVRVEMVEPAL